MEILKTPVEDLAGSLKAFIEASTYIMEATYLTVFLQIALISSIQLSLMLPRHSKLLHT